MNYQTFKKHSKWLSQISAVTSLIVIVYVQRKFVFDSGNIAATLVLISLIAAIFTFIFGFIALPKWQGFVALGIFGYVAYCILFTRLYGLT